MTFVPRRTSTPRVSARSSSAAAIRPRPPATYQEPKACSAYGTLASAAGARRGSDPVYVAYRSSNIRSRGSDRYDFPIPRNVRHGATAASSSRWRESPSIVRTSIGDSRNGMRVTSQIRWARSENALHCAPRPSPSAASSAAGMSRISPGRSRMAPSGKVYRQAMSRRWSPSSSDAEPPPVAANRSSRTWGSVNRDGPVSNTKSSIFSTPSLPPTVAACSTRVTACPCAARRVAAANPPTPAPTTTMWLKPSPPDHCWCGRVRPHAGRPPRCRGIVSPPTP